MLDWIVYYLRDSSVGHCFNSRTHVLSNALFKLTLYLIVSELPTLSQASQYFHSPVAIDITANLMRSSEVQFISIHSQYLSQITLDI